MRFYVKYVEKRPCGQGLLRDLLHFNLPTMKLLLTSVTHLLILHSSVTSLISPQTLWLTVASNGVITHGVYCLHHSGWVFQKTGCHCPQWHEGVYFLPLVSMSFLWVPLIF